MSYCRSSGFHLPGSGFPLLRSIRRSVRFLHRYCTAYLRRIAVYFHYGHRFLRTCRKSDDQRWYLPPYRKFCQLPGRQCARRNEPGTGFSLRILRSLIRFRSCNCYCYRYHALQRYGKAWLPRWPYSRTVSCIRWSWTDHPPIYHHGHLLYFNRRFCWKHV